MRPPKTIIFLPDGMADEPVAALGGRTPLQAARTPAMDSIARDGASGTLLTLPEGYPTSSDVANMSVLGCDLATEMCGRGPLEAAGRGISLGPSDVAYRVNLTNVADGVLRDFSGGHVGPGLAAELIALLNAHFGDDTVRFHPGVSYRNILVLRSPPYSENVATDKPDDNHGECVDAHFPRAMAPEAQPTAELLRRLMVEAPAVLEQHPGNVRLREAGQPMANGIWPWSGGRAGRIRTLAAKYGIAAGAVISAVDVIKGLGRCLGMGSIAVPGATGYIDTNYEGKARAAIEALKTRDFVYLHVEAIDEVSHAQDLDLKIKTIENVDARLVAPVLAAIGPDVNVAVLPDHPVPVATGKHTRVPPPVAVRMRGLPPDGVTVFDEIACKFGSLGDMRDGDLMALLFGAPRA
jgi:2,3-bisphosphoglycerate-independent phosphoglycerate mutase